MKSSPKDKSTLLSDTELRPDAWERFERAVDAAVKSGPKHKIGKRQAEASTKAGLAAGAQTKKPASKRVFR